MSGVDSRANGRVTRDQGWRTDWRDDFPILARQVNGKPLVYVDHAASSLTPQPVLAAMDAFYRSFRANVHRGLHTLSGEATAAYEGTRDKVAAFLGAPRRDSIVFTRGATAALNLVAQGWAGPRLQAGDVVVLTRMEHHANLVPWQMVARATGASLRFIELTPDGTLDLGNLNQLINDDVKVVSLPHISNVLGAINPVRRVIDRAHAVGAVACVDAAQSVGHLPVDVGDLDCDFLAFSGHKMCGPTGIGVLYGRPELLAQMEPIEGGGDMIEEVGWESSTWNHPPYRFEAGTPPIAEAIGLGAAIDYLSGIGLAAIAQHTQALTELCARRLAEADGVTVYGPLTDRLGPVAFTLDDVHPHDVAQILDAEGVAVRAGHHCTQPLHQLLGLTASVRASFYLTNQPSDVDRLVDALQTARQVFGDVF